MVARWYTCPIYTSGFSQNITIMTKDKKTTKGNGIGIGSAIGVALGAGYGYQYGYVLHSMALGLAFGVAIGAIVDFVQKKSN